jgi:hypothetical protein
MYCRLRVLPPILMLLALCTMGGCTLFCRETERASIGHFGSAFEGERAATQKLSQLTQRCRKTKSYSVSWRYSAGPQERGWRALKYERVDASSGWIGYEVDPESGIRGDAYLVDDTAVQHVAQEGGTLENFSKYSKGKP